MTFTPEARAALKSAGLSRRRFLKGGGALVVGFSAAGLASRLGLAPGAALAQATRATDGQLDSWLAIAADGGVTAYTGKCELGQGMHTAQIQVIAEELGVPMARIRLVQCDTAVTPDQGQGCASFRGSVTMTARSTSCEAA